MTVENIGDHMALTCECGSVRFCLLKSGGIECHLCSKRRDGSWGEAPIADSLASAGGVEVVAYGKWAEGLPPGTRLLRYDGVPLVHAEPREGFDVALVTQASHLAALAKEREVADGLAALLEEARDDVSECLNGVLTGTGLDRYERRIASYRDQLACIDAALTAHRESRGNK